MTIKITKIETAILTTAAAQAGQLARLTGVKETSWGRALGRLLRDGLVEAEPDGDGHRLTGEGYRAIGLEPPRPARTGTKQALVLELLGRDDGASLDELMAATGWLPHSTRAVLSRLRSAGTALAKSTRPEGGTAYKIEAVAG